jgi:AcrR family transcriptional regulator
MTAQPATTDRHQMVLDSDEVPATPRRRRAYGSVRPLLLESARRVFAEKGYGAATTREIAQDAGTTERLLFHHFGTKLRLFQAAVMEPFADVVNELTTNLDRDRRHGEPLPMRDIVGQLYRTIRENRDLSIAMTTAYEQGFESTNDGVADLIGPTMTTVWQFVQREADAGGWRETNMAVVVGNVMAMITATALFRDYFFSHNTTVTDDEIISELADFIAHGVMNRHDPPEGTTIDQTDPYRIIIRGPDPLAVTSAAADWVATWGSQIPITDMSWHNGGQPEMRIYLQRPADN